MGLFSDSPQTRVNQSGKKVYNEMIEVSDYLKTNGKSLPYLTKSKLEDLDNTIIEFLNLITSHTNTVHSIDWNGKSTMLMGVIMTINAFVVEIKNETGFSFRCQQWFNS